MGIIQKLLNFVGGLAIRLIKTIRLIMKNILYLNTSVGSFNRGDDIIMECFRKELGELFPCDFVYDLPTHVSAFHWYQVLRKSFAYRTYAHCDYKFVGGSNLLVKDMLTHYPQWNVNIFNYHAFKGCVLCGVGAGAGDKTNCYTRQLYRKMLSGDYCHSVRDERSKEYVESLGLKAINTGCVTMWMLTPEHCQKIPTKKAKNVVFTLTESGIKDGKDQQLIDILCKNYEDVYFWVQGNKDFEYINKFERIDKIKIVNPSKDAYEKVLEMGDMDYVGTRLHAGIYAMRHFVRTIIIAIDERARGINQSNNLVCIDKQEMQRLESLINSEFTTEIKMPLERIEAWKSQFK